VEDYIKKINSGSGSGIEAETNLTRNDELSEFMFLGLRMTNGISKENFEKRFCTDIYSEYNNELKDLIDTSLIIDDGENVKLTPRGIDVSNQVFVRFLK
jgi:oxygen-independent coproporphyrinogen-3 oxidase